MYYDFWSKSPWLNKVFYSILILIRPFIHAFSLSSILPFSHSIRSVRPFVCPSVQLFSSFVHPFSPFIHLSIHFICPSICPVSLFIQFIQPCCLLVYLSVCQSVHQSVYSVGPSDNITVCPICLLVPPSVHLSIDTRHPFSLSGRPSFQSVHLSIQTLLISSSVISRGISIQPTEMTGPVKVS